MLRVFRFFTSSRPSTSSRSVLSRNGSSSSSHSRSQPVSAHRNDVAVKPSVSTNKHYNDRDLQNLSKEELLKRFPNKLDTVELDKALAEGAQMKRTFSSY
jgi:hypothetical protein